MTTKQMPLADGTLVPVPVCEVCGEVPDDPEPAVTRKIDGVYYHFYACEPHWRQVERIGKQFKPPKETTDVLPKGTELTPGRTLAFDLPVRIVQE